MKVKDTVKGSVLVIGGGISGMQAALDLADQDFKVYLVEKSPSIGGRMAQLDKTFPTNDCAMCIEGPKMAEVARHPNIELLTYSEVTEVKGFVGNFKVKVSKKPRYIDEDKCNGCGECALHCPVKVSSEFDLYLGTRSAVYVPFPQATPLVYTIDRKGVPPCKPACPLHLNVQGYVALIANSKFEEALELIKERNPLPAVCGRVCHHPCEEICNRGQLDEPIAINALKRFVADYELQLKETSPPVKPTKEERVAIIGSGPAGLTAAHDLARLGYRVTVYEALPVAGGMLSVGIPGYRLPKDVLQAEIKAIGDLGVEIRTDTQIGKDLTLEDLTKQYDAVFIAVGAHQSQRLNIPGEDLEGVFQGVSFLRSVNLGNGVRVGNKVAVIGGGNVAVDAARSALRLGAKEVSIVYRRTRAEMPANEWEIEDAEEEGVTIQYLAAPTKILGNDHRVVGLECIRMGLGELDESGRRRPIPIPGSEYLMEVDTVIVAIGQALDLSFLEDSGLEISARGTLAADDYGVTNRKGVFAGGDAVSGPATVTEAMAAGKRVALAIHKYLSGEDLKEPTEMAEPIEFGQVNLKGVRRKSRQRMPKLPMEKRVAGFGEVELGFMEEAAMQEARRCLNCGVCSDCRECQKFCEVEAIDYEQTPTEAEVEVGSIIVATGFEVLEPKALEEYCYGIYPNVLTALQYERLLAASGPTGGEILNPSDSQVPERIAWIQCVGSRDPSRGYPYCSRVCCAYATKQAMITKEHHPDIETYIFYIDRRTYGKGFEEYYRRGKEAGIEYIRGSPGEVFEDDGQIRIKYEDTTTGEVKELTVDLLVLSAAIVPNKGNRELAKVLGIELDENGFFLEKDALSAPLESSREGIYLAGCAQGPKDIPDSVAQACGAAARAAIPIHVARGEEIERVELVPEKLVTLEDKPRIGIFICHCGINIAGVVDVEEVTSYAKQLPNVVYAEHAMFTCSDDAQSRMKGAIEEYDLNRVVMASCTPTTHEPLFQATCREAGLNPYLFEMATIREHCSWVHSQLPEEATEKAKELVEMAVAKSRLLEPLRKLQMDVNHSALVIGGGIAGMTSALSIADLGFNVHLIEREKELGGMLNKLYKLFPADVPASEVISPVIEQVLNNRNIEVHTETEIKDVQGYVGNYQATISENGTEKTIDVGAIVVATGAQEIDPTGFYGYGTDENIITQPELEQMLKEETLREPKQVVMINCVGAREDDGRTYCCRIGCGTSLKNAKYIKELYPGAEVFILYQDMVTFGKREEEYYTELAGVNLIRYSPERKPEVEAKDGSLVVKMYNQLLQRESEIEADLVVLTVATEGASGNDRLQKMLKVPLGVGNFFSEVHAKIRPLDFVTDGIYLCGSAHFPKGVADTIAQAQGAASRACTVLSKDQLEAEAIVAEVKERRCVGCGICVAICPYDARELDEEKRVAMVNEVLCQGCGACAVACPSGASKLRKYKDDQFFWVIDTAL